MAGVVGSELTSGGAKRLAGRGSCPYSEVVGDSGEPKRLSPSSDACKEMALSEVGKVVGLNFEDAAAINSPFRYQIVRDELG